MLAVLPNDISEGEASPIFCWPAVSIDSMNRDCLQVCIDCMNRDCLHFNQVKIQIKKAATIETSVETMLFFSQLDRVQYRTQLHSDTVMMLSDDCVAQRPTFVARASTQFHGYL